MIHMSTEYMLNFVRNLKIDDRFNDTNMVLYKDHALQLQKIFYEISLIISNFFKFKRGGGIITPFNKINSDILKGITDFTHGFKNEIDKITNGTGFLIMSIYQNMIFQKIDKYTLENPKHFKDIENIIIILLKDLVKKYNHHKYPQKFYVMGGKKKKIKKKGGVAESILITGIIISAVWALLQMFDNINEKYKKWVGKNEGNSQVYAKPTLQTENNDTVKRTPKTHKTPRQRLLGIF